VTTRSTVGTWIVFGLVVSILSAAVGMAYFGPEGQRLGKLAAERASTTARFRAT
jgi:hypothetical protein